MTHKAIGRISAVFLICAFLLGGSVKKENSTDAAVVLDPKNPVSVEIWHYYNGPQKSAFDSAVNEFNETVGAEKGIVIEAFSEGTVNEVSDSVVNAAKKKVGAEKVPDVFAAYPDTAYELDRLGLVADLDSYFTKEELAEYVPGYLEEGRFSKDKKLKIFPVAKSTEIMMLNKTDWDKFATEAGVSINDLKTVEGITTVAQKYYNWTDSRTPQPNDGKAFFGRDALSNYFIIGSMQLGKELFSVQHGKCTLNMDKSVMRKLWDNYYVPYLNGWFCANGKFRTDDMRTGDIIAMVCSTSGAAYFPGKVIVNDTQSYPIESFVAEAPRFAEGKSYVIQQSAGMVVTKSDKKTEYAATVFLKWFTDAKRNLDFAVKSGYIPVKTAATEKDVLQSVIQSKDVSDGLKQSLLVGTETVQSNVMYMCKAFGGGMEARTLLEKSMTEKLAEDTVQVDAMVKAGASRKEAAAKFTTESNFESWYDGLKQNLEKVVR